MSFATITHRRRFERFLTILSAFAVLMSLMVMLAPAALAHHPEISASKTCVDHKPYVEYDAISWKTDGTPGSGHADVRIEVSVAGSGSWTQVGSGAFTAGNNYRFSGEFDASAYWGSSIEVRARTVGPWDNGVAGGQVNATGQFLVDQDCTDDVTVTPQPQVCEVTQGTAQGSVSFAIAPGSGATVQVYTNSNYTGAIGGALGDGQVLDLAPGTYYWQATAASGYELSGAENGQFEIEPCEASVVVASGECSLDQQGNPLGSVTVTIDPTSGATVVVTGAGGPYNFSGAGGSQALAPGTYNWSATAASGFELTGPTNGSFTVDPCEASVVVAGGECEIVDGPQGSVTVFIDASSGAVVTVFDSELDVVAQFTGSGGSQELAPGTYTWQAVPGGGFEFPEGQATSGEFTIDPCVATAIVTHGNCVVGAPTALGSVTVSIDPNSALTLSIMDKDAKVVATFTGTGGTQSLIAGSYTWVATTASGFTLSGEATGGFTVVACPDSVLGEVIENDDQVEDEVEAVVVLPFTGIDTDVLAWASVVLLASGVLLVRFATRREEGLADS